MLFPDLVKGWQKTAKIIFIIALKSWEEKYMNSLNYIHKAFQVLQNYKELGATDYRNLNIIIPLLDSNGFIQKKDLIDNLFKNSQNPDGAYRNFLFRLQSGIENAIDQANKQNKENDIELLNSIKINKISKTKTSDPCVQFIADKPKNFMISTVSNNKEYDPENFIESKAVDFTKIPKDNAIKLFISYASNDKFIVQEFKKRFNKYSEKNKKTSIIHWSMDDLIVGDNFDNRIKESLKSSDYGLALISEAFFDSPYITDVELKYLIEQDKLLPIGLESKIKGKHVNIKKFRKSIIEKYPNKSKIKKLFETQIFYLNDRTGDFYSDCDKKAQDLFIRNLYIDIQKAVLQIKKENQKKNEKKSQRKKEKQFKAKGIHAISRTRDYDINEFIEPKGERDLVNYELHKDIITRINIEELRRIAQYDALEDMFNWVKYKKSGLYALLGDYGMGKTFTCRMFALELEKKCKKDLSLPKPVYIDLRDVPTFVKHKDITRQPNLEEIIESIIKFIPKAKDYSAKDIIFASQKGKQVIIFDGLDEKLVYYTKDMRSQFLRQLLRIFPQKKSPNIVKIIISCRTHHFESIMELNSFLLGFGRSGIKGINYRALNLLPFSLTQILSLLTKLFEKNTANNIFSFIKDEKYLKDLAKRPLMLKQLSSTLPELKKQKDKGSPINSASFYKALISDNINRDQEKHIIKPRHKKKLLMELSASLWKESSQIWKIDDLNDWFQNWLNSNDTLYKQYSNQESDVLERDLRNSTLLVRFGDNDFGFSHTSIQEYFLSKWIIEKWQKDSNFKLNNSISKLTEQFIMDNIELLSLKELKDLNKGIENTFANKYSNESKLAISIIIQMTKLNIKTPMFEKIDLSNAKLENIKIQGLNCKNLILNKTNLFNSKFKNCTFNELEINNANLSESLWEKCFWHKVNINKTSLKLLKNLTFVQCNIPDNIDKSYLKTWHYIPFNSKFNRKISNKIFTCNDFQVSSLDFIDACDFSIDGKHIITGSSDQTLKLWDLKKNILKIFKGHSDWVKTCAFSPNGKHIISGSDDKTLKLWDIKGNCLKDFKGHSSSVLTCAFSPNGKYIISGSSDDSIKLWDLKGNILKTFKGHSNKVNTCSFSPNGKYIISGSSDNTLKLWDLNGNILKTFIGHSGSVWTCLFSPDGKYIISGSSDKILKLWDLKGNILKTFKGHSDWVRTCIFSSDGKYIISGSYDKTLKLWDLNGNILKIFKGHLTPVLSCTFSPDGEYIISGSSDSTIRIWDLNTTYTKFIYSSNKDQWYSIEFDKNKLKKIKGTELSWKIANFEKDGESYFFDDFKCFEYHPSKQILK